MSLLDLPEFAGVEKPKALAFEPDPDSVQRWRPELKAKAASDSSISILDAIGQDYFTGEGVTAKRVTAALRAIGGRDVVVNINSPGGDFFEGVAIYNALRDHSHKVTVRVLGLAASAASVIAMAGDEIEIGTAGFMMVHNAWGVVVGNRMDLQGAISDLETFDGAMAEVYAARSGASVEAATAWMDAETWFSGREAISAGLATGLLPADAAEEGDTPETRALHAKAQADAFMMRGGASRTTRRALWKDAQGGTQNAALTGTQDAADLAADLLQLRQQISL